MLLQRHISRICRKKHKSSATTDDSITKYAHNAQAQRVFKTAPLYAVTNPEEAAPQDIWTTFTTFFESLWSPSTNPDGTTVQKAGMSYAYDEDGTLIAQTLTGGAQTSWGQSARYVYLPTASGPMPVAAIYGTKHYAIQSDHLNTPRRLIQSDGQVAWQWAYSAFGEEKPTIAKNRFANTDLNQSFGTTTVPAVTFNLRYPGQYFDQESNLHYNYHRSYHPGGGRYTQADPIGLDGGWNRFGYVEGNPLSKTDSLGLFDDALPLPIALPTLTGICLANPLACAGAGGYAVGTLINPIVQPIISSIIDACTPDDPPCSPSEGTKCWDIHTDHSHAGLQPHFQIYQMAKVKKICGWQKRGGKVGKGVFGEQPEEMKNCRSIPGFTPR
jgi:RHS repeat-associated protein